MKRKAVLSLCLFLFVGLCSSACSAQQSDSSPADAQAPKQTFIRGSFIQPHLFEDWDDARWQAEFDCLREAGMDFIIFMHTVHANKGDVPRAVYPTAISGIEPHPKDLLEDCLRNAKRANFKVFVGLNFDERWWELDTESVEWLIESLMQGNAIAAEITNRYKTRYPDTLHGWYWVWEVEPAMCKEQQQKELLVQGLNINLDYLKQITPTMPVLISPFMNHELGSSDNCMEVWDYVLHHAHFKDADIFAPQDCIGSGFLNADVVEEWFGKLARIIPTKPKIQFWGNIELFDQRFWTTAPMGRVAKQIELIRPYVSEYVSFAYSHYYSPMLKNPAIHKAYVDYVRNGETPQPSTPPSVEGLHADETGQVIVWKPVKKEGLMGYHIYKNDILVADLQLSHDGYCPCQWSYPEQGCTYEVTAYDVWGTESDRKKINVK